MSSIFWCQTRSQFWKLQFQRQRSSKNKRLVIELRGFTLYNTLYVTRITLRIYLSIFCHDLKSHQYRYSTVLSDKKYRHLAIFQTLLLVLTIHTTDLCGTVIAYTNYRKQLEYFSYCICAGLGTRWQKANLYCELQWHIYCTCASCELPNKWKILSPALHISHWDLI